MSARFHGAVAGLALALAAAAAAAAAAQPAQQKDQPGGAIQGLQLNRDQPVKIESATLDERGSEEYEPAFEETARKRWRWLA